MLTLPLAALALLAQSGPQANHPRFAEMHRVPAPVDGAVGDVDGDGDLDIVRQHVHINDGRGFFRKGPAVPLTIYKGAPITLADVDADGDLDLLALWGPLYTLYNDGHGNFHDTGVSTPVYAGTQSRANLITGDLDGDGAPEVFVALGSTWDDDLFTGPVFDGGYVLMTNDGAGHFTVASDRLPPPAFFDAGSAALVDLDLDGDRDIVVNTNQLFLNDGLGNFTDASQQLAPYNYYYGALLTGDLNGDGAPDLVTYNGVQLNDGTGHFSWVAGSGPLYVGQRGTLVDLNADGDLDVIGHSYDLYDDVCCAYSMENDGSNTFTYSFNLFPPFQFTSGDFDADGDVDWVGQRWLGDEVAFNDGFGRFEFIEDFDQGGQPTTTGAFAVSDVDDDGDMDAITVEAGLFLNDGTGSFHSVPSSFELASGKDLAVLDLDGDGDEDLAIVSTSEPDSIYLNEGGTFVLKPDGLPSTPSKTYEIEGSDVDGDGDIDLALSMQDGLHLFSNDGTGSFTEVPGGIAPGPLSGALVFGNIDADGAVDFLAGSQAYLNDGAGIFVDAGPISALTISKPVAVDIDADGFLDVIGNTQTVPGGFQYGPAVFINDRMGNFTETLGLLPSDLDYWSQLKPVDWNGDGASDLALVAYFPSTVPYYHTAKDGFLVNDGTGRFRFLETTELGYWLEAFDADGDGDTDILHGQHQLALLRNLSRQLAWRNPPRAGVELTLDLYGPAGTPWRLFELGLDTFGGGASERLIAQGVFEPRGRAAVTVSAPRRVSATRLYQAEIDGRRSNRELARFE